jgi:hypothetical protein
MVRVLTLGAVDRGFELRSGQTKDYKIGICCCIFYLEELASPWTFRQLPSFTLISYPVQIKRVSGCCSIIQFLIWDGHKHVAGLNWLTSPKPAS